MAGIDKEGIDGGSGIEDVESETVSKDGGAAENSGESEGKTENTDV